jgi:UDP-N-acetylenolpyruvoylglucosamine reductase
MKTFFMLYSDVNAGKLTKIEEGGIEEARRQAKVMVNRDRGNSSDVIILKAVEAVRQPVPDAEVIPMEE